MPKFTIELSDELSKYVEFMSQEDINIMFADMLAQRINGETQPVVTIINSDNKPSFDEEVFFTRLEAMLAERTVVGTSTQPKTRAEVKSSFKKTVETAKTKLASDLSSDAGDEVMADFLANIFK